MKKSLFAIAAVTAFAGAAQAQSSVTVYGILDAGYVGGNQRAQTTSVTGTNNNGFSITGQEATSRLGFKGVEDLGAGRSAFFTVEVTLPISIIPNLFVKFMGAKFGIFIKLSTGKLAIESCLKINLIKPSGS